MKFPLSIVILLSLWNYCAGLHLLAFYPEFISSYNVFFSRYAQSFAAESNNTVTIWRSKVSTTPIPDKDIEIPGSIHTVHTALGNDGFEMANPMYMKAVFQDVSVYEKLQIMYATRNFSTYMLNGTQRAFSALDRPSFVQGLYNLTGHFDVIMGVPFDLSTHLLAEQLGIHKIIWSHVGCYVIDSVALWLGVPRTPSYVPTMQSSSIGTSFWQRASALMVTVLSYMQMFHAGTLVEQAQWYVEPPQQDHRDALWEVSWDKGVGAIINGDLMLDLPRPLLHNLWYLGTPSVSSKGTKLDDEWQSIVDNPKSKGTILMSFGTMVNVTFMPEEMKNGICKSLCSLSEYEIIWRFASSVPDFVHRCENVHIVKWMPQRDILFHPNTKVFITHGGYNSLLETSEAGVPMVMVPLAIDQHVNAQRAVKRGTGTVVHKADLYDPNVLIDAVNSVIADHRLENSILIKLLYVSSSLNVASMHHDQIVSSRHFNNHMTATVIKPHYKRFYDHYKVGQMSSITYFCLDVIAFWLGLMVISSYTIITIIKKIIRLFS